MNNSEQTDFCKITNFVKPVTGKKQHQFPGESTHIRKVTQRTRARTQGLRLELGLCSASRLLIYIPNTPARR